MARRIPLVSSIAGAALVVSAIAGASRADEPLAVSWKDNFLSIRGDKLPGEITINYLEAYCRPGSTDRDWHETVIGHKTELVSTGVEGGNPVIKLKDTLRDGVVVEHTITARPDEVDFRLSAHNPTKTVSQADWAQPCIRIDKFTGCDPKESREVYPKYIRQCFLFLDGKLTRMPTEPWTLTARYTPGQVYAPKHVDRNDVNPRPLSKLVPSSGLCGCFSADGRQMMAIAWEPYQEVFQGVATCLHNDFRVGGLKAGERKTIRGKLYIVPADAEALVRRFERDFPEQSRR
ncbi:MAG: hypothetical protein WD468_01270 [Pirellulales bacterium]